MGVGCEQNLKSFTITGLLLPHLRISSTWLAKLRHVGKGLNYCLELLGRLIFIQKEKGVVSVLPDAEPQRCPEKRSENQTSCWIPLKLMGLGPQNLRWLRCHDLQFLWSWFGFDPVWGCLVLLSPGALLEGWASAEWPEEEGCFLFLLTVNDSNENLDNNAGLQRDAEKISLSTETQETGSIKSSTNEINYALPVIDGDEGVNYDEAVAVVNNLPNDACHHLRVELVKAGPEKYQNKDGPFASSSGINKVGDCTKLELRSVSKEWFYKLLENGDRILRSWLLFSKKESGLD
ncbi:unnamed protein product [Clavelina lepadiformis]|uniref:Uncharacterized protein n=1 Tax=Clavelina lepadiformis TaxID=159417 RepID=A0ABP0G0S6_CLALP